MDDTRALLSLQERDTELDQLRFRKLHLPARAELEAVLARQRSIEAAGAAATAERDELARRQAELETDLTNTEKRLADIDRQMRSGSVTASRDLQAMAEQVASMKRRQSDIEDADLEVMEALEPVDAKLADLQAQWAALEADAVRLRGEVAEAEVAVDTDIVKVEDSRQAAIAAVPPALLATYERLRQRLGGIGVAPLVGASCGGCHLTLSASELDRIRRLPADEVVTCDQCGRILVR